MNASRRVHRLLASRAAPVLLTAAVTAVASVLTTWPLAREMGSATLRSGEVLLTAWQINWFHHALLTNPLAWVDANIFFPYDHAATFNDLLLTHALVTLPFAWAESPVLALNLAFLGGIVLCGVCAHLLIAELSDAPWPAAIGGILFALTPFRFLHLGHLSIAAAWAVPLFFWALLRHLRQPSWRRAALAAGCGLAVGLSSLYHAAYVAPIIPLVLLFGLRRGPGGRAVWLPLLVAGLAGLAVLASFLAPYAETLRSFGSAAAPGDLNRYGADLSSLGQRPDFLGGAGETDGIDAEAHLYPGAALALLAAAGALAAALSVRALRGWQRGAAVGVLGLGAVSALGLLLPPHGPFRAAWELGVLALIWIGPVAAAIWAIAGTTTAGATGPAVAIRLGVAGAVLSFVLALGPEARYLSEAIGPAPYWLLAQASSSFEGTRVPARFGGLVILFLALVAAGALTVLARGSGHPGARRLVAPVVASLALVACLGELPIPSLPEGRELVALPELQDPAYRWVSKQPGRFGILELPDWAGGGTSDYEHRGWRALRYMLASKQHGQHLVNGSGRIEPFLWNRFRTVEGWSPGFFAFIAAYFPVDYVLVHESGIPVASREAVRARLDRGTEAWQEVFRSDRIRVFRIDRSAGRGTIVDRVFLRREIASRSEVVFSARLAPDAGQPSTGGPAATTMELLRDGEIVGSWALDGGWRQFRVTVPVDTTAPDAYRARCSPGKAPCAGWPQAGALFRWRVRGERSAAFEIRSLSIERSP